MSARHVGRTDMSAIGLAAEETEVERAANRQLIQEGRLLRSKELERLRNEEENGHDVPRGNSNGTSRFSSQRSSVDLNSGISSNSRATTDARDLRMQLIQLEDQFKGAMMINAQLDNDKQVLRYEVDLLKDKLDDMTELNSSLQKAFAEKKRDLAYHRLQITELTNRLEFARKQIEARDELIQQHNLILLDANGMSNPVPLSTGIAVDSDDNLPVDKKRSDSRVTNGHPEHPSKPLVNGLPDENGPSIPSMALITKATAELLRTLPETTLDSQISHLFKERSTLMARIEKLERDLEEERRLPETTSRFSRSRLSSSDQADLKQDIQNLRSQAQDYKFKLQEALQKNSSLESDIVRLEGQIKRYKTIADTCEQQEADLKQDRRKFQRELREVQNQLEDVKSENARLQRKLDKALRNNNTAASSAISSLRGTRESSSQR